MSAKTIIKIIIDTLMTVAMPFLMAYMLIGAKWHEWIGTGVFLLFIIHHIINHKWLTTIAKGRYNVARTVNLVINVLIFLCMIGLMYSGIVMSRSVFSSLKIQFVFFDTSEPVIYFLLDYAAIMALFAAVGYYIFRLRRKPTAKKAA